MFKLREPISPSLSEEVMKTDKTAYRFALGVALGVALILVAVGVIGTPDRGSG
ncbi:MAG: hypothetical protein P9L92_04665 [Candidatus Electryonea clarkiae]|nr:hypothetical protein [Candidatus Electryonea clarkiae]